MVVNGCMGKDGVPLALEQDLISFSGMQSRRFSAFSLQAGGAGTRAEGGECPMESSSWSGGFHSGRSRCRVSQSMDVHSTVQDRAGSAVHSTVVQHFTGPSYRVQSTDHPHYLLSDLYLTLTSVFPFSWKRHDETTRHPEDPTSTCPTEPTRVGTL